MKKFLVILILIFTLQTPSQADDIRDFQIEGISIGDSLLDYMTEKEIIDDKPHYYKNKKFAIVTCIRMNSSSVYDFVNCTYKPSDKKYKIFAVEGVFIFKNNIEGCYKKKDKMVKEISEFFENAKKVDSGTYEHDFDKSGESKQTVVDFMFSAGGHARVVCHNWSEKIEKKYNYYDELKVYIVSKEFDYFINNEAYK